MRPEWADFFDGHAPVYDDNCFTKNTAREVEFLLELLELRPGGAILDVGCGTGRHAVALAQRGYAVTGLDLSTGMLAQARRRAAAAGVPVQWVQADATRFALPQSFDAAICLCEGAFGLLNTPDDPLDQPLAILRNIAAALRPEAPCLFTVLNGYRMIRRRTQADVAAGRFDPLALAERSEPPGCTGPSPMRERGFVPTELVLLFAAAGLEVQHIWGGTAGNWGRRPIDLDEFEIMVVARKGAATAGVPAEWLTV
ncbi:MAG: class I SAM-dependent methyltransferase [Planctomycetota bacterium]